MPELPDVVVYIESLARRIMDQKLERIRLLSPFVLRSVAPSVAELEGRRVAGLQRIGKRIVIALEGESFIVIHLMIAGRLRWMEGTKHALKPNRGPPSKLALAALEFSSGTLAFTEAGSKKRASLHLVQGKHALKAFDLGGIEVLEGDLETFTARLTAENHTLKRALTDPKLFSGIGNSYSDEILHRARLSPIAHSNRLTNEEIARLYDATRSVLSEWIERLRKHTGTGFPENVTAFRPEMSVHGKYGRACPVCGAPVQRIVYAENETNYCARCQTEGAILADRALSRLLKSNWPRSIDELS